jgi:hypothetical protein
MVVGVVAVVIRILLFLVLGTEINSSLLLVYILRNKCNALTKLPTRTDVTTANEKTIYHLDTELDFFIAYKQPNQNACMKCAIFGTWIISKSAG